MIYTWLVVTGGKVGLLFGSYNFVMECWEKRNDPNTSFKSVVLSFIDWVGVYGLVGLTWPLWTSFCFLLPFWADANFKREAREQKTAVDTKKCI